MGYPFSAQNLLYALKLEPIYMTMTAAIIVDDGDDDGGECGVGGHLSGHLDGLGSSVGLGELGCFRILSHFGSHRSLHIAFACVCVCGGQKFGCLFQRTL